MRIQIREDPDQSATIGSSTSSAIPARLHKSSGDFIILCVERVVVPNDDSLDDLLDELETHGDLDRVEQALSVRVEERRYGKAMTIVAGFSGSTSEMKDVASDLKSSLATGGTTTDETIELQGDHRDRLPDLLRDMGYSVR